MFEKINRYLLAVFSNSDVNKLLLVIAAFSLTFWFFISELAPLLGAVLIAYILDGMVLKLEQRFKLSRTLSVTIVIAGTILLTVVSAYTLPRFLLQLRELGDKLPEIGRTLEQIVENINEYLPDDAGFDQAAIAQTSTDITGDFAAYLVNNLFGFAGNIFSLFVYLVLLPLLVFFLLRDKEMLAGYLRQFMPQSPIFGELWLLVNEQFGSYLRGKVIEAVIIGALIWIIFLLLDVEYALSLSVMIGLSVFVPFVGAVAVTFPVVLFAYLQFGWSPTFAWVVIWYTVVQMFDGQILVPLLFSEVIKIHPVALFSALIFFGNLWGIWGVFFAIPLASLIKCIISVIVKRRARQAEAAA